ncbi:winged helix DNA-binding protein [Georgenia soli]|uniref:Winged helix DNA-binding protein n=1 Tax=Georgenia soli TaxID=638953 RepID=A0A2A9ERY4_9MICO|nr:winged helix DNA-binding domain-containing protein [Georgenia soli]PFG41032.1 winged helix DNA-binding protein [Georgenia soli]
MRTITNVERRARLARRHRLAPGHRAADVVAAAESMVGLHATLHATVHLAAWARVDALTHADVDGALYTDRTLVKQMAMRSTLFVLTRQTLPAAVRGPGARVAAAEERLLVRDVERAGLTTDGARWVEEVGTAVVAHLSGGAKASWHELRDAVPALAASVPVGRGGSETTVGSRLLTALFARGVIVRCGNDGSWLTDRPRWTTTVSWLGGPLPEMTPDAAPEELVRRWLRAFGPGTDHDLAWWPGEPVTRVRATLRAIEAEEVALDGGAGYVLPDDLEPEEPAEPWAALLPVLDPTTMGWHERDWYLGRHRTQIFDPGGNGGATAWWDGRVVGTWHQLDDEHVRVHLLEDVGPDGVRALEREAQRLTDWLDGARPGARWPSPALLALRAGRGA